MKGELKINIIFGCFCTLGIIGVIGLMSFNKTYLLVLSSACTCFGFIFAGMSKGYYDGLKENDNTN